MVESKVDLVSRPDGKSKLVVKRHAQKPANGASGQNAQEHVATVSRKLPSL